MRPYLRAANVKWSGISLEDVKEMDFTAAEVEVYKLRPGDLVLNEASGSIDEVGKPGIWRGEIEDCCIQNTLLRVRPRAAAVAEYLYFHLLWDAQRKAFVSQSRGVGIHHIGAENLSQWPVRIPPVPEQHRVVKKVETLRARSSAVGDALAAVPALLDRLRQSILAAAFRGDLTADWRARNPDVEPAEKLLEKIRAERRRRWEAAELAKLTAKGKPPTDDRWKERYEPPAEPDLDAVDRERLPELPSSWCWASIDDLQAGDRSLCYGVVQPGDFVEGGIPLIRVCDLEQGRIDIEQLRTVSAEISAEYSRSRLQGGEILISVVGTIGKVAVVPGQLAGANIARAVAQMFPSQNMQAAWIASWLQSTTARRRLNGGAREVARKTLNIDVLRRIPVPMTSEGEQEAVRAKLEKWNVIIDSLIDGMMSASQACSSLDTQILAKAFRGELVPQDPNDEPASVLLERLRTEAAAAPAKPGRRARAPAAAESPAEPITASAAPPTPIQARRAAPPEPTPSAKPARPAAPGPVTPVQQPPLPGITPIDFLELPADTQSTQIHALLLGEGALEREDAVRRAAELLRDTGRASFQRLRRDGTLATCIDAAIAVGLRQGSFDRPTPGHVRALAPTPEAVPPSLWRRALLAALAEPETDADAAVRDAAAWSQAQFGLEFQRLRTGGRIDTALRTVLAEMLASRELLSDRHGILSPGPRRG